MIKKEYLSALKNYILLAIFIFLFGFFSGYLSAQIFPEEAKTVLQEIREIYRPVFEMNVWSQFFFVLLNNALTVIFIILFGVIFGIPSFFALFSNGTVLGLVTFSLKQDFGWQMFLLSILPHGIIEIPVLILGGANGLKIGYSAFKRIVKKQDNIKQELLIALEFLWKILLPLLLLSSFIEIFITANLLGQ